MSLLPNSHSGLVRGFRILNTGCLHLYWYQIYTSAGSTSVPLQPILQPVVNIALALLEQWQLFWILSASLCDRSDHRITSTISVKEKEILITARTTLNIWSSTDRCTIWRQLSYYYRIRLILELARNYNTLLKDCHGSLVGVDHQQTLDNNAGLEYFFIQACLDLHITSLLHYHAISNYNLYIKIHRLLHSGGNWEAAKRSATRAIQHRDRDRHQTAKSEHHPFRSSINRSSGYYNLAQSVALCKEISALKNIKENEECEVVCVDTPWIHRGSNSKLLSLSSFSGESKSNCLLWSKWIAARTPFY